MSPIVTESLLTMSPRLFQQELASSIPLPEREQRIQYLRQAVYGFFIAKNAVEMDRLGRVMCMILGLSMEEQAQVMDTISKISPAVFARSTINSWGSTFSTLFS